MMSLQERHDLLESLRLRLIELAESGGDDE